MNYLAIYEGEGSPTRDLVNRIEAQTQVKLVKSGLAQNSHVIAGDPDTVKMFMAPLKDWRFEPTFNASAEQPK